MTLHEAIQLVLEREGRSLTATQIANIINKEQLYKRTDNEPVGQKQIRARVSGYKDIFYYQDDRNISLKEEHFTEYSNLVWKLADILRSTPIDNYSLTISLLLYIYRKLYNNELKDFFTKAIAQDDFAKLVNKRIAPHLAQLLKNHRSYEVFNVLDNLVAQLPNDTLEKCIVELNKYSIGTISDEEFGAFFNNFVSEPNQRDAFYDIKTPFTISNIIDDLCDVENGDSVFDPFAGAAGLFTPFIRTKNISLTLQELNASNVLMGLMNLDVNKIERFNYSHVDSFVETDNKTYDWVITHPPLLGQKLNRKYELIDQLGLPKNVNPEVLMVTYVLSKLKDRGKALIVLSESFFFSSGKQNVAIRKQLIENKQVEYIVSLPSGAFSPSTGIKCSILMISNKPISKVKFIELNQENLQFFADAGNNPLLDNLDIVKHEEVEFSSIAEQDYILTSNRYVNVPVEIEESSDVYCSLEELLIRKFPGKHYKDTTTDSYAVPYVNVKDLSGDNDEVQLNLSKVKLFIDDVICEKDLVAKPIPQGAILVAKVGRKLKPTYVNTDQKFAVSNSVYVLVPDQKRINGVYLLSQLFEEYVEKQLDRLRAGTSQPFTSIKDLLSLKIRIPSFEVQQSIAQDFLLKNNELLDDNRSTQGSKQDEIFILSAIKHEYDNILNPFQADWKNLNRHLNTADNGGVFSLSSPINSRPNSRSVYSVIESLNAKMKSLSSLFVDISEIVNIDKGNKDVKKEQVELVGFLTAQALMLEEEYPNVNINVSSYNDMELHHDINKNLFGMIIRNFIKNSSVHGMHSSGHVQATILITETDDMNIEIDLINDGKPFPENFTLADFISFGQHKGKTGKNGIGGYIMNKAVKYHDGNLSIVSLDNEGVIDTSRPGVHFKITLPK